MFSAAWTNLMGSRAFLLSPTVCFSAIPMRVNHMYVSQGLSSLMRASFFHRNGCIGCLSACCVGRHAWVNPTYKLFL
ncbi:hypothetical protein V8C26DRAFT_410575 [Trichoderma gracile]